MSYLKGNRKKGRGFTLLELLVVAALVAMISLFGFPALYKQIKRRQLEGFATESANSIRLARYQAIKTGRPTTYSMNPVNREILSWVDEDDDAALDAGERVIIRTTMKSGVNLCKPATATGGVIDGFGPTPLMVRFNTDGSVDAVGAFRLCDHGSTIEARNFLEVRVRPRSVARVEINKWDGTLWWGRDEGPSPWVWY